MKKIFLGLVLFFSAHLWAQQEPQYTQYMFNPAVINPAYAGSLGHGVFFGLYRTQWIGLEGAPKTVNVAYHQPLESTSLGIGINLVHDQIGPSTTTFAALDVSYSLKFNNETKLAFGIKAGGQLLDIDYTKLDLYNSGDNSFQNNVKAQFSPNIGAGIYYYGEKSYIGISVPFILQTKRFDEFAYSDANRKQHIYLTAGRVFDLTTSIKFKPCFVVKSVPGAPLQADATANFLFNERFMAGVSYRWSAALSAMIGIKVNNRLTVGYGYDRETTRLANFNSGSHEIFLQFDLFKNNQQVETPRFF